MNGAGRDDRRRWLTELRGTALPGPDRQQHQETYSVHLNSLIKDGRCKVANVALEPGDILIIPQSYF